MERRPRILLVVGKGLKRVVVVAGLMVKGPVRKELRQAGVREGGRRRVEGRQGRRREREGGSCPKHCRCRATILSSRQLLVLWPPQL